MSVKGLMVVPEKVSQSDRWKYPSEGSFLNEEAALLKHYDEIEMGVPVSFPKMSNLVMVNPNDPPLITVPKIDIVRTVKHLGQRHIETQNPALGHSLNAAISGVVAASTGYVALGVRGAPTALRVAAGVMGAVHAANALSHLVNLIAYAAGADGKPLPYFSYGYTG